MVSLEQLECPRCHAPENTTHVLCCTAHDASAIWDTNMMTLIETLAKLDTPLPLQEALVARLNTWRSDAPLLIDPQWPPDIAILIQSQDTIGWKNFLEGLPSRLWVLHMTHHYTTHSISRHPQTWMRQLLRAAHHLAWSQWEHRNHILHHDEQPRLLRANELLNDAIGQEYLQGVCDLPISDHHHFRAPLGDVLALSTTYKQSWYLNVMAARQRQDRRIQETGVPRQVTDHDPQLTHWIATGRLR
jgi:hypothetical protein